MNIIWVDDVAAEVVLNEIGIDCVSVEIQTRLIDRKASRENRARENPLDESRIEGIRSSAEKGVPIPKLVIRKLGEKFIIAGGNHRFAALGDVEKLPAHLIECTDAEFEIACRLLNTVVGVGMGKEERIKNAIDAIDRLGLSRSQASKIYGVSKSTLSNCYRLNHIKRRIVATQPASARNKIKQSHINILGDLCNNDNVLGAALELIYDKNTSFEDLVSAASVAKTKTTEAEQVRVFKDVVQLSAENERKVVRRNKRSQFLKILTQVRQLGGIKKWSELEVEKKEIETMKSILIDAINSLKNLSKVNG